MPASPVLQVVDEHVAGRPQHVLGVRHERLHRRARTTATDADDADLELATALMHRGCGAQGTERTTAGDSGGRGGGGGGFQERTARRASRWTCSRWGEERFRGRGRSSSKLTLHVAATRFG